MTIESFAFGDAEPVSSMRDMFWMGTWLNSDGWYDPPVPPALLASTYRATPHHGSAIQLKRNMLCEAFIPSPQLSAATFRAWVLDYLVFGNAYLAPSESRTGKLIRYEHVKAKYTRRGENADAFYWVPNWKERQQLPSGVLHLMEPDTDQEIYGVPDYLGALQATLLNESATLFRRRYYLNGNHAGFILYISDAIQNKDDVEGIKEQMKGAKGIGNFKNLLIYSPNGKKDGVQVIPIAQLGAADEFAHIFTATRDSQLAAHRIPPQLLGIVPPNGSGFGSVAEAEAIFRKLEVLPLQSQLAQVNAQAGRNLISFRLPPDPPARRPKTRSQPPQGRLSFARM